MFNQHDLMKEEGLSWVESGQVGSSQNYPGGYSHEMPYGHDTEVNGTTIMLRNLPQRRWDHWDQFLENQ